MSNRIKTENSLQFRKLWKWFALALMLTVLGLVFVFQRVKIHNLADEIASLERNLEQVRQKNGNILLQIEKEMSPKVLQAKVMENSLHLIEMTDPSIQVVDARNVGDTMVADRRTER